jgi:hypothetical protein
LLTALKPTFQLFEAAAAVAAGAWACGMKGHSMWWHGFWIALARALVIILVEQPPLQLHAVCAKAPGEVSRRLQVPIIRPVHIMRPVVPHSKHFVDTIGPIGITEYLMCPLW